MDRIDKIVSYCSPFVPPGQITELRALGVGGAETWAGWFDGADLRSLAAAALELEDRCRGLYFVPNPVNPPAVPLGQVVRRGKGETTDDSMVARRRWMLIDIDPVRFGLDGKPLADPACPATDAEKRAAWSVVQRCRGALDAFGLSGVVVGDSGNGWHLCYPVDLPNDDASRTLCRSVLATLATRADDDRAKVDLKTFNAARIWKLYGTRPRKGRESDGRSWRYSSAHVMPGVAADPAKNVAALRRAVEIWAKQDKLRNPEGPASDPAAYARKALESETGKVMTAAPGTRNNVLNAAAFALGQLVAGGGLTRDTVEASLMAAAAANGLSRGEAAQTIRSGIEAGLKEPRTAPDRPAPNRTAVAAPTAGPAAATAAPSNPPDAGINCADLMALEIPEPRYAVAGLIPEGVTILAARPKQGKSWLALQLALGVAQGQSVMGGIETEPGDVLYLALEDTRRRLKKRVAKILAKTGWKAPGRLEFRTHSDRGLLGIGHVDTWLKDHPEARLVIVDTLAKFRPPQKAHMKDGYAEDYEIIGGLKSIADRHAVAVVVIHHSRKAGAESPFDEVSGTLGLTGAADAVFVMQRAHDSAECSLFVTGRDVEEETLSLSWDDEGCLWSIAGRSNGIERPAKETESRPRKPQSPRVAECARWVMQHLMAMEGRPCMVHVLITEAMNSDKKFAKSVVQRALDGPDFEQFDDPDGKTSRSGTPYKWVRLKPIPD